MFKTACFFRAENAVLFRRTVFCNIAAKMLLFILRMPLIMHFIEIAFQLKILTPNALDSTLISCMLNKFNFTNCLIRVKISRGSFAQCAETFLLLFLTKNNSILRDCSLIEFLFRRQQCKTYEISRKR